MYRAYYRLKLPFEPPPVSDRAPPGLSSVRGRKKRARGPMFLLARSRHPGLDQEIPGPPPPGPRFKVPARGRIGKRAQGVPSGASRNGLPCFPPISRFRRIGKRPGGGKKTGKPGESGIRFPGPKPGLSDESQLQWTVHRTPSRNILDREYHANWCAHRQHAAPIQGPRQ